MAPMHDDDPAPSTLPRTLWVLRYATALHKLASGLDVADVMSIAMREFDRERDRQPEQAAQRYARRQREGSAPAP